MPLKLDKVDVDVIQSLLEDGRKSFRQVSREIGVSTPTVKARYERLVRSGLIRAIVPDLDLGKVEKGSGRKIGPVQKRGRVGHTVRVGRGMLVRISCDYCKGPVHGRPATMRVGRSERFFCCTSCRSLYREKYREKIRNIR
ncbi:MAG TPA: winged helix-turn-helix transcriptional regulator [Candidatus Nitrosotalea sp.]|nr:winged helix-turn-helix transcriptional regulator [Candidatus Nitrosotalea sp.]